MKEKIKVVACIMGMIVCIVGTFAYTTITSEGSPDWKATYQKHYIPDNGGYYVEFQRNVWTYSKSGRTDSSLFVFVEPDTTVDVGHKRLSFEIIDFDIDGQIDRMRVWERPSRNMKFITDSDYEKILQMWIYKNEKSGKWEFNHGTMSYKTVIAELPALMNYYYKAKGLQKKVTN